MEPLKDSDSDRVIKDVPAPPHKPLNNELLFSGKGTYFIIVFKIKSFNGIGQPPNWEILKNHLYKEGRLSKEDCKKVLKDTLTLISKKVTST